MTFSGKQVKSRQSMFQLVVSTVNFLVLFILVIEDTTLVEAGLRVYGNSVLFL